MTEFVETITHNGQKIGSIRAIWGGGYLMTINTDYVFSRHELPTLGLARDYAEAVKREHPDMKAPPHPSHCHCPECDPDTHNDDAAIAAHEAEAVPVARDDTDANPF